MLLKMKIDSVGTLRAVSREFVPTASRKSVAGEVFAAMSNSDPTLFERLAKVEPTKLARLLVELAAQDQTILEQVQFLLASGDTTAIAKAVRSTLRAWKRSPRFIHYQEAFAFGEQLDRGLSCLTKTSLCKTTAENAAGRSWSHPGSRRRRRARNQIACFFPICTLSISSRVSWSPDRS
jgi:hypothetical protein